jgi:hypothetical protein
VWFDESREDAAADDGSQAAVLSCFIEARRSWAVCGRPRSGVAKRGNVSAQCSGLTALAAGDDRVRERQLVELGDKSLATVRRLAFSQQDFRG